MTAVGSATGAGLGAVGSTIAVAVASRVGSGAGRVNAGSSGAGAVGRPQANAINAVISSRHGMDLGNWISIVPRKQPGMDENRGGRAGASRSGR